MYKIRVTKRFIKGYERLTQKEKEDADAVMELLQQDFPLPAKYRDHLLNGKYKNLHDCHIRNNIVLLYEKQEELCIIKVLDIGTHARTLGL